MHTPHLGRRLPAGFAPAAITLLSLFAIQLLGPTPARATAQQGADSTGVTALTELSIEELMDIEVTSVSRKREALPDAPAAVYVISQEDIRRSGARSLAEVLRLAPGLQVARVDSDDWGISARGFTSLYANKMLVLVDGRAVYTRLFSGVYWEMQDLPLPEVDRIEVVRGPGGTMWGANAVNGVINVITKPAVRAPLRAVEIAGGSEDRSSGAVRVGGSLGSEAAYRISGTFQDRDGLVDATGSDFGDDWRIGRGQLRVDWQPSARDQWSVAGGALDGTARQTTTLPLLAPPYQETAEGRATFSSAWGMGRWSRTYSPDSDLSGSVGFQTIDRDDLFAEQAIDVVEAELQHRFRWGGRRELVWGLGFRQEWFALDGGYTAFLTGDAGSDRLGSAFAQLGFPLAGDRLRATVGSKFEVSRQAAFEAQPSARLLWSPSERQKWWAAASRAVRTPSITERHIRYNQPAFPMGPTLGVPALIGNPDLEAEELIALELGWRVAPLPSAWLDLTAFHNRYRGLTTVASGTPFAEADPAPAHTVFPQTVQNGMSGETWGLEAATEWRATPRWRLALAASWLQMELTSSPELATVDADKPEDQSPHFQANLRSYLDLAPRVGLDVASYYVGHVVAGDVPAYLRLDARVSWRVDQRVQLSVGAENLLQRQHREIGSDINQTPAEVQRAIYAQIGFDF